MSWQKSVSRRKKLSRIARTFGAFLSSLDFQVKPQNAEHNGRWSGRSYSDKKYREKLS